MNLIPIIVYVIGIIYIGNMPLKEKERLSMAFMEFVVGNIGRIDDLRELGNDNAVINFSVVHTPRSFKNGEWVDGEPVWVDVSLFGSKARTFARSNLKPGVEVIVAGKRTASRFTPRDSQEEVVRQSIVADYVGLSINPFTFVEKVGFVSKGEKVATGTSGQQPQASTQSNQAYSQPAPAANPAPAAESDPFSDPFGGSDDSLFGDDDNPFGL